GDQAHIAPIVRRGCPTRSKVKRFTQEHHQIDFGDQVLKGAETGIGKPSWTFQYDDWRICCRLQIGKKSPTASVRELRWRKDDRSSAGGDGSDHAVGDCRRKVWRRHFCLHLRP